MTETERNHMTFTKSIMENGFKPYIIEGENKAQQDSSYTINELYQRMLMNGSALQVAMQSSNGITREEALRRLEAGENDTLYHEDSEILAMHKLAEDELNSYIKNFRKERNTKAREALKEEFMKDSEYTRRMDEAMKAGFAEFKKDNFGVNNEK